MNLRMIEQTIETELEKKEFKIAWEKTVKELNELELHSRVPIQPNIMLLHPEAYKALMDGVGENFG